MESILKEHHTFDSAEMTENNADTDKTAHDMIIKKLSKYKAEHEDNQLIINKLIKTIDNNIKNNNERMITKLDDFYEYISNLSDSDNQINPKELISTLNDIFKLEKLNDKNLKNIEDQLKVVNNGNIDMEDILNILEYNE
ncbi:hypothetical protein DAHU10_014890 [Hanseniaspora uvarum]|nr:hypothetical protein DAHU10_014890 [Hanseniaspora uvarum]